MFEDFVAAWNSRRLPARYYRGEVGGTAQRTSHQWGIKGGQFDVLPIITVRHLDSAVW